MKNTNDADDDSKMYFSKVWEKSYLLLLQIVKKRKLYINEEKNNISPKSRVNFFN